MGLRAIIKTKNGLSLFSEGDQGWREGDEVSSFVILVSLSVIFAKAEIQKYSQPRMDPRFSTRVTKGGGKVTKSPLLSFSAKAENPRSDRKKIYS